MLALLLGLPFVGPLLGGVGSIIKAIGDTLGKILPGIVDAVFEFIKVLWEGFKDVLDTWQTIVFVLTLCACVFIYGKVDSKGLLSCESSVQQAIQELRKDYVFVKRKDADKHKLKDAFKGN